MKRHIKVSCGIIQKDNQYLIVQRPAEVQHALLWEFPGGKIEPNETATDCIIRELKEELDIIVEVDEELPMVKREEADFVIELIPFHCTIVEGQITLLEHEAMEWITLGEPVKQDLCKGDCIILEQLVLEARS